MGEIVLEVGQLLVILNDLIFLNNERNQFALSITNFGPLKKNLKFKIIYIYIKCIDIEQAFLLKTFKKKHIN